MSFGSLAFGGLSWRPRFAQKSDLQNFEFFINLIFLKKRLKLHLHGQSVIAKTQKRENEKTQKRENEKTRKHENAKTQKRENAKMQKCENVKT